MTREPRTNDKKFECIFVIGIITGLSLAFFWIGIIANSAIQFNYKNLPWLAIIFIFVALLMSVCCLKIYPQENKGGGDGHD
jgi:cytochrome c biogenesis protein CcdA